MGLLVWGYKMLISSDIPVNISFNELTGLLITIFIFTILEYFYIKKHKSNLSFLNLVFFIILFVFWFGSFSASLAYNYHIYATIIDIIGFISIIIIMIEFFTYKIKKGTEQ